MAWEISHTTQAWANVRAHLMREWSKDQLVNALCDELFERIFDNLGKDTAEDAVSEFRWRIGDAPHDALVESVIECIERHNTCSNGGHEFYIDPEGYHRVSCDLPSSGLCGACKCNVELVEENEGIVHLSCGCTTTPEEWASEE